MSVSFTAPAAEQLSLLPYAVTNQQLQFTVGADTNAYFVLQRSLALPRFDAYAIGLGLTNNLWTHPIIGTNTNAFFRLMTVPVETPVSSLDDGIDDLFKIRLGLNPLDPFLAGSYSGFYDGRGEPLSWLQYYLRQFPGFILENYSREYSVFNLGVPTARYEALSRELSIYNGESPAFVTVPPEVYSREVSVFSFGLSFGSADAVSREYSVFNFGVPTARYEALSRELSIYNGESPAFVTVPPEVYSRDNGVHDTL